MPVKLKRIELRGFRGAKKRLDVPLPAGASLLLYGENGSGKSTLTDGMEWFYYDRVAHLTSEGIGRKGTPALRNWELNNAEDASVTIELTNTALSATRTLSMKGNRLVSAFSNSLPEFESYKEASAAEHLLLRWPRTR